MRYALVLMLFASVAVAQVFDRRTQHIWYVSQQDSAISDVRNAKIINVKTLGAVGDGVTDDRLPIQHAIDLADSVGGATVYLPPGVYLLSGVPHPWGGANIGIQARSHTILDGAGMDKTTLLRQNAAGNFALIITNRSGLAGLPIMDSNIVISNMTLDGNSYNQRGLGYNSQGGVSFWNVKNVRFENVRVRRNFGTTSGADYGEGMAFNVSSGFNIWHVNCIAEGDSISSTGFSLNATTNAGYVGCQSYNHLKGAGGYTIWTCNSITYVNCSAWGNTNYTGFNNEYSRDIVYQGCQSGFITNELDGTPLGTPSTKMPNYHGFVIGGGNGTVSLIGCSAIGNLGHGVEINGENQKLNIIGGSYRKNTFAAVHSSTKPSVMMSAVSIDSNWVIGGIPYHQIGIGDDQYVDDVPHQLPFFRSNGTLLTTRSGLVADAHGVVDIRPLVPTKTYSMKHGDGWYRIIHGQTYQSGTIRLEGIVADTVGNYITVTDMSFSFAAPGYNQAQQIQMLKRLDFNGGMIDSIRVGNNAGADIYLDVKVFGLLDTTDLIVSASDKADLVDTLTYNPVAPTQRLGVPGRSMGNYQHAAFPEYQLYEGKIKFNSLVSMDSSLVALGKVGINTASMDSTLKVAGSAYITDGLRVGGNVNAANVIASGATAGEVPEFVTADSIGNAVKGQATFSGTNNRVAVYLPGTTTSSLFFLQPVSADGTTLPLAGDWCQPYPKTDSLAIIRPNGAAGTSGLVVNYFRAKK